jgi:orotidine-5'-phosphate decarboxylase
MTSPVYVALDTVDPDEAKELSEQVRGHVGGLKLGLEYFSANGPAGVREISGLGLPIFLDVKLHDIPNTVARAVQALRPIAPAVLTVHAAGGRAMMAAAKAAAPAWTRVIGVTVLTSLDDEDLIAAGVGDGVEAQVERLAAQAREAGLDGVVCSGREVAAAKAAWPDGFFVVSVRSLPFAKYVPSVVCFVVQPPLPFARRTIRCNGSTSATLPSGS